MAERRISAGRSRSTESLSESAYQLIRDKILRGQYPLGAALSRRQIAKELRMSFVPISGPSTRTFDLIFSSLIPRCLRRGSFVNAPGLKHEPAMRATRPAIAGLDGPAVKIDDAFRDGQAQPCSLARRFRGEERVEDFAEHLRRDAAAGVIDLDQNHGIAGVKTPPAAPAA